MVMVITARALGIEFAHAYIVAAAQAAGTKGSRYGLEKEKKKARERASGTRDEPAEADCADGFPKRTTF